ncbi:Mitochondrial distribution and morphology protein 31, mitochondrial precursor [Taxawa tesnikishii (nom. ined.)]|nr:Mitochondrial distribution and morphology protein 31, mitochondrial precursor [Dothideales sp. JES 119]
MISEATLILGRALAFPLASVIDGLQIIIASCLERAEVKHDGRPETAGDKASSHGSTGGAAHNLLDRLPHLHRPTKEELLAAATGFWSRLRVRFKWFSIRSVRPFNTDDISAFVSWVLVGHVIWIILGTTTFFSLAIFAVNTVFAQETLARWVGNYLTQSAGVKVLFESAIVPKWGDGVISFRNVFVSRRPGQGKSYVSKGSSTTAAAAAAAAQLAEKAHDGHVEEDTNYTQYDLHIDTVNVTLSFTKWFNGKGLLRNVEIKGIRGVVDRTSVQPGDPDIDPRSYKHVHNPGDFEIDSFKMEDVLITVYQPNNFRPFSVSVFSCDLPRLRKQWLFYDLMSANMMSGSFDDSLFTIHPRQTYNHTGLDVNDVSGDPGQWKKHSRLRIDGLNIDHLNRGVEGPFSWIHEGNVDIVADIMFPVDEDASIAKVMSDFYDRMEATVTSHGYLHTTHQHDTSDHHEKEEPHAAHQPINDDDNRFLVMDLRIHLNDVRAAVPLFTRDISYVSNALVRPIVAYINSKRAFIPVNCRVVKCVSEFDGSWTIFDSGLMGDLSRETYEAFARDIVDDQARVRRLKKVGIWTIQLAAQALFIGLADGATVIQVEKLVGDALVPNVPRWRDMLTKLRMWEYTTYSKICYIDADMLITKRLDGIFWDEATLTQSTSTNPNEIKSDEAPLPRTYTFAGHADFWGYDHAWPPPTDSTYVTGGMMEQDLLNYAHRREGNMPWKPIWYGWNVNWPTEKDWKAGAASFHAKYWDGDPSHDPVLKAIWREQRAEMEGFYRGREMGLKREKKDW